MLHQLLLLRHAKAAPGSASLSDHARPLNLRGRQAAETVRRAMRERGLQPDLVLVSSARRTLQTLERLEPWAETPLIEPMDALYLANPTQLLRVLHSVTETVRSVLLVAHNPGLHELALRLAENTRSAEAMRLAAGFPTATLAEFSLAGPWRTLGSGGLSEGVQLRHLLLPDESPDLAA